MHMLRIIIRLFEIGFSGSTRPDDPRRLARGLRAFAACMVLLAPGHSRAASFPAISVSSAISAPGAQKLATGPGSWLAPGTKPQWLIWDFGTPTRLTRMVLTFPSKACWSFTVDATQAGSPTQPEQWTTLMTQTGQLCSTTYTATGDVTFRFVRVTITGGSSQFGLSALTFDATAVSDRTAAALPASAAPPSTNASSPVAVMEACDLWSSAAMWRSVLSRAPFNQPLSGPYGGLYDDTDPATTSARIALARQAGITAFQSCWYRQSGNAGQPVVASYSGVVRALADTSALRGGMQWNILWDNANTVDGGISGTDDFLGNLTPFWISSYFLRANYLRIDGKPVIVIASADKLANQLGGVGQAAAAIARFRAQVAAAGLPGVLILGCNNASSHATNATAAAIGFDAVMAYATPIFTGLLTTTTPTQTDIVAAEKQSWADWAAYSALPSTLTVSMGYDASIWSNVPVKFALSPSQLGGLLADALAQAKAAPASSLRHKLMFIDNWNEYGEGRFIEPSLAYGGSYLNAISAVLCPSCRYSYRPARGVLSQSP